MGLACPEGDAVARKDERKKQKKRLKEKRKAEKRAARSRYPNITLLSDGEDPSFMNLVAETLDSFDFTDPAICSTGDRNIYRVLREFGFERAIELLESPSAAQYAAGSELSADELKDQFLTPLLSHLGEWIFEKLPEQYRTNPLPFYFYHIFPHGRRLAVSFRFLPHVSSPHGTIYFSPFEPTVQTSGGNYTVGFTRHSLERACQRLSTQQSISYRDFQRVAMYFRCCVYFEPVLLPDDQAAIRLLASCDSSVSDVYLRDVARIEESKITANKYFFVLGYCPVRIVQDYAVATTFLCPGYRGTPEDALVNTTPMNSKKRQALRAAASGSTLADVANEQHSELLKWYHENGVPQVVTLDRDIFRFR